MPLSSEIIGQQIPAVSHHVDARWLMAYAASLGDYNARYLKTNQHTVVGHPLFPVCLEWPVILDIRSLAGSQSLTAQESTRGVHAAPDLHIYRLVRAEEELHTEATMIGVQAIKPGAAYTMRLDTRDQQGELVAQTFQLGIYRGVAVDGESGFSQNPPAWPAPIELTGAELVRTEIHVPAGLAHTYTECARIWNPIHTDAQIAQAAGLPDIILHGTATMALAASRIVDEFAGGDPHKICRIGGRFAAMVLMPSTITVEAQMNAGVVSYQVRNAQGDLAISHGFAVLK